MSGRYNLVKEFIVKPVTKVVKDAFKSRGKNPTPGTINTVPIAKNLTTKRKIQDKVVAAIDKGVKSGSSGSPGSQTLKKDISKMKIEKSKELKDYSYTMDKAAKEKVEKRNEASKGKKFNKGGRVGLRFGSKKKSDVQKIKETFGPKQKNGKVPNKFKGFSKLPEKVQQKIDAKLAKKV